MKKVKLKIKKKTLLLIDWANVYGWGKSLKWEVSPIKLYIFLNRPKVVDKRLYHGVDLDNEKSANFKVEMENIGYTVVSKDVKWPPVLLKDQNHFKKIVQELFNVLDKVKNTNSELSNRLYELIMKIQGLSKLSIGNGNGSYSLTSEKYLKEIFEMIEEVDGDLKKLNIDIGELQNNLTRPVYRRKCDFDVEITRDALNLASNYDTLLLFSGDGDYSALTMDLIQKGKKVILVFAPEHLGREYLGIESHLFYACSVNNLKEFLQK